MRRLLAAFASFLVLATACTDSLATDASADAGDTADQGATAGGDSADQGAAAGGADPADVDPARDGAADSGEPSGAAATDVDPARDGATDADPTGTAAEGGPVLLDAVGERLAPAPPTPIGGQLDPAVEADLDDLVLAVGRIDFFIPQETADRFVAQGDPRLLWLLADLLRFTQDAATSRRVAAAFEELSGATLRPGSAGSVWRQVTDHLIAWDLPAPPDYREWKRRILTRRDGRWDALFTDPGDLVDWRLVTWGGVHMDRRPLGDSGPCYECIPALDDPGVTDAAGGDWYDDDDIVFGVVVNGEARAYPRNVLAVHELINDRLGGRRIGMPFCTLCGSAQAYFTDGVAGRSEPLVLRTSGLLIRSNKVMYDLTTDSVIDTFRGSAISGPLRQEGVELELVTVVTSTWGAWKAAHPDTTIVAEDGGIGRRYPSNPLGGRDSGGPVFAVGDVDPRLGVQEAVLGVELDDGTAVAFPAEAARAALAGGETVQLDGVVLSLDGDGLRASTTDGAPLASHQAYWFAWSQFRPATLLWDPGP